MFISMTDGRTKELKLCINKQLNTKNTKWHINTTIDTSFSIQIMKSYHFLFCSISFSNWDGHRPYYFSSQNIALGLFKLSNIQSFTFLYKIKKYHFTYYNILKNVYIKACKPFWPLWCVGQSLESSTFKALFWDIFQFNLIMHQ